MTLYGRSSRWTAALALALASVIGVGAAMAPAAPARTAAASAFELTLEARDTTRWEDDVILESKSEGTFRSRAPFCATGTFDWEGPVAHGGGPTWRFTCDDGTGSLTVSIAPMPWTEPRWNSTWHILAGSGDYAGLRGRGSLERELLSQEISDWGSVVTWRSALQGTVDHDAVAPTINFSSATATKLRRPAGAYALKLRLALRDDVTDHPVSYTLRVATVHRGIELARKVGTAGTGAVSMTLRIRPPAGARNVRVALTGEDPVGNAVSVSRAVSLRR